MPTASAADVQRIREAIRNATSLAEVERLTRILQSGNIPEDFSVEQNGQNGNGQLRMSWQRRFGVNKLFVFFQAILAKRWKLHKWRNE